MNQKENKKNEKMEKFGVGYVMEGPLRFLQSR